MIPGTGTPARTGRSRHKAEDRNRTRSGGLPVADQDVLQKRADDATAHALPERPRQRVLGWIVSDRAMLAIWDLTTTVAALALTGAFAGETRGWTARLLIGLLTVVVIDASGAYRRTSWLREHPLQIMRQLLLASTIVAWAGVLLTAALGTTTHLAPLFVTWLMLPVAWYAGRRVAIAMRRARPERILIIGTGAVARRLIELAGRQGSAAVVVGCLDDGVAGADQGDGPGLPILGGIDQLPQLLSHGAIDRVIVAFSSRRDYETLDVLRNCNSYRGAVDVVPRFFDFVGSDTTFYKADELALLSVPGRRADGGRAILKRAIDFVMATVALVVLSPVLLIIAAAILLDSGPPVLFRQRRIGRHGVPFSILKFRTLKPGDEAPRDGGAPELSPGSIGQHVERAKREAARRATRVGAFLRKTSLDELPQLFNVLAGEMSLVGPRPLSELEDAVLEGWESLRREVRPGITGLWQVSGRSETSWESRVSLDYAQVRHWSLSADLQVMIDTVRAVVRRRGAE
jgi:exopolysaccharide biosynthesis polyprenyl glycosylphosphotransferase